MKFLAREIDQAVVFIVLVISVGVFWPPSDYFSGTANPPSAVADPYSTVFNAGLIAFLTAACFLRAPQMRAMLPAAWPILPLLGLAFLSALWSIAPEIVLLRATRITATVLFGIYLIGRADMPSVISLLVKVSLFAAAASFAVFLVAPKFVMSTNPEYLHAWRGAFTDKNQLGMMAAFGIIAAFYAFRCGYGSRLLASITILANLVLLALSASITAVLVLPAALYVAVLSRALRGRSRGSLLAAFAIVVVGILGAVVVAGWFDELLAAVGRNPTLSNRTRIWAAVLPYIAERPWLGYGLETFWLPSAATANRVWSVIQWKTPHSHNLWLELCLALGLVGLTLAALLWASAFWRAIRLLVGRATGDAGFALVLLVAIFLDNLTEFAFFRGNDMQWLLFGTVFAYLGRELSLQRRSRSPAAAVERPALDAAVPAYRVAR